MFHFLKNHYKCGDLMHIRKFYNILPNFFTHMIKL